MTTWEALLKGLVKAVRHHGVDHDTQMAEVLDSEVSSAADLDRIIDTLPPQLVQAPPERLGDPALMSAEEVRAWFRAHGTSTDSRY